MYNKTMTAILRELDTQTETGLSSEEAKRRLDEYGMNRLKEGKKQGILSRLWGQLRDPMILVLLAAAALSLFAGGGTDWADAIIILLIVVVNACISISQEDNARRALSALRELSAPMARVLRDGTQMRIDASLLVPGDIIFLEAGDYVPADARLCSAISLKADESAMTGESLSANKTTVDSLPIGTALGDRKNMVIAATVITAGRGTAIVTATGMDTEVGKIANLILKQDDIKTPLQKKMSEISKTLSFVCVAVCFVMFGVGLLQHKDMLDLFLTAVSLAVAAIPEGLPAIVTIVLAMGVQRMAKFHAIVKKLPAVETLGCASVICSDKTGTLTQNKMTVVEIWSPEDAFRADVLRLAALCNNAKRKIEKDGTVSILGDPTECALVELAALEGIDKNRLEREMPRKSEVPFDSARKRMSTVHRLPNGTYRVAVKGAPDVLLPLCTRSISRRGTTPIGRPEAERILGVNAGMASRALRVIAVAYRDLKEVPRNMDASFLEWDLTFVGLSGMIDPPRPEVKDSVSICERAGIRALMITGDHQNTAIAIAKELGMFQTGDLSITGEELDFLPQELLESEIEKFSVFARVSPEHKMRIVRAWQAKGKIVAMTGDGVNDAPALKAADIGCAMGKSGTDVAKAAADMILMDDNFTSVVHAVEQGRGIYANIKKAIHYLLSCNIGEIITIFTATVLNFTQMPLVPVQLLWLNLVTDSLPALALGVEPVEDEVMDAAPRDAHEPLFSKAFSFRLVWQGLMVGGLTLFAFFLGHYVLSEPDTADAVANTMAFATLTLCQLFHAYDVRSEEKSIFKIGVFKNRAMNRAFVVGFALQLAVLCIPPLQTLFCVVTLSAAQWIAVLLLAITPLVLCEWDKAMRRTKKKQEAREVVGVK